MKVSNISFGNLYNVSSPPNLEVDRGYTNLADKKIILAHFNDENDGQEYADVQKILKRYPDRLKRDVVKLEAHHMRERGVMNWNFFINDKEIQQCDLNLCIFDKLAKILRKISNLQKQTLVSLDYLNSKECLEDFAGTDVEMQNKISRSDIVYAHELGCVKKNSTLITDAINETMAKYFKLDYNKLHFVK
jgi:hypothetical protein